MPYVITIESNVAPSIPMIEIALGSYRIEQIYSKTACEVNLQYGVNYYLKTLVPAMGILRASFEKEGIADAPLGHRLLRLCTQYKPNRSDNTFEPKYTLPHTKEAMATCTSVLQALVKHRYLTASEVTELFDLAIDPHGLFAQKALLPVNGEIVIHSMNMPDASPSSFNFKAKRSPKRVTFHVNTYLEFSAAAVSQPPQSNGFPQLLSKDNFSPGSAPRPATGKHAPLLSRQGLFGGWGPKVSVAAPSPLNIEFSPSTRQALPYLSADTSPFKASGKQGKPRTFFTEAQGAQHSALDGPEIDRPRLFT